MAYVIVQGCCNDASCVSACPVDCIRPRPGDPDFISAEQLYIDPASCIECAACMWECPVGAIHDEYDMPAQFDVFRDINAEYFERNPLEAAAVEPKVKRATPTGRSPLRVAVVGAGPSGCYATGELSNISDVQVSLFDRLPTPFGLIRAGVAPDHQKTKQVSSLFQKVLKRRNVHCYFNVELGRDITVNELLERHHAVIFAAGADTDRKPGVPGEDLPGAHSAREFVSWYNSHPDHVDRSFDLSGERVVIIGNGNVALDLARVFASPPESFNATDMSVQALAALRDSAVREILVVGRRGALDAAYTTSEFMALSNLAGVDVLAREREVRLGLDEVRFDESFNTPRKAALAIDAASRERNSENRSVEFRYFMTPTAISGEDAVESITFSCAPREGGEPLEETLQTRLVLFATGYRSSAMADVPFDPATSTIPNQFGRVVDQSSNEPVTGYYCAGWAKRGATGVIGSNRVCSAETVGALLDDYTAGRLADPPRLSDDLDAFVAGRQPELVHFEQWVKIDEAEQARGVEESRPRTKFHDISEMVKVARG